MNVLLTGATGFTGSYVLQQLRSKAVRVCCLVRSAEKAASLESKGVEVVIGDLGSSDTIARASRGCDTLINVASIGFGHGPEIVRISEQVGIKRAIFVSTTAVFTQLNAPSKAVRLAAETAIRASSLKWTILRPTMVYGSDRDRNVCRLIRYLRRYPLLPIFGSGEYLQQPIYVEDLASAIVASAGSMATIRQDYNLSGQAPLTYNDLVQTTAKLMGRRIWAWHLPYRGVAWLLGLTEKCRLKLPIKAEQVLRLNENKTFSWEAAARDFGFSPRAFSVGVAAEIRSMGIPLSSLG